MATTPSPSRRGFLGGAAATAAGVTAAQLAGAPLAQAMRGGAQQEATPAHGHRGHGSLGDIEHVVILMQENRSLDHYYGTMRGVRGYGDRAALVHPDGTSVFRQPDTNRSDGYLLPWHADTARMDGQDLSGNDHSWGGVHTQWADGANSGFAEETGDNSLAYFTRDDVPFNRALAQAFTFCDNYFCSIKGPTTPNRLFHWTGTIDPRGVAGGPAIYNPDDYAPVFTWTTYPERLQRAGVSWRVFANDEVGDGGGEDGFVGDYGDNPLWLFKAYHDALASSDPAVRQLAERASVRSQWKPNSGKGHDVNHVLKEFIGACKSNTLPAVSWVVAPYAYSEHPAARPVDGAAYTQTVLNAIWSNPDLWRKTAVFINYDEHDGFFDHVISPTAPPGTPDEFVGGLPVGLGPRVPMTVVSPWTRGGWIDSQVFDHTSVLRFLELWTGVREPNISAWRRQLCGDLTSCFDFSRADFSLPKLPDTAALRRAADAKQSKLPKPMPPAAGAQKLPVQEPGHAKARALPYQPYANATVTTTGLRLTLGNGGCAALQVQVQSGVLPAQRIDVPANGVVYSDVVSPAAYDVTVHGPNGFVRRFTGAGTHPAVEAAVKIVRGEARLEVSNGGHHAVDVLIGDSRRTRTVHVAPGTHGYDVPSHHGWYDVVVGLSGDAGFARHFAGHVENGRPSVTG